MRRSPSLGHLPDALAPRVETHQGYADRSLVSGRVKGVEGERLDRRAPVRLEGRGRVEESLEFAFAQRAEGVAERPGAVEEVLLGLVPTSSDQVIARTVEGLPDHRDRDRRQLRLPVRPADQVTQDVVDHPCFGRSEGDLLGADEPADEREPAVEDDGGSARGLGAVLPFPVHGERPDIQRVDPTRQAGADAVRLDAEGTRDVFVLVLDVPEDERPVSETDHAEHERLHQCGLATARFAEDEDVGVGHRDGVVVDPSHRVAVEGTTGEDVEPHRGSGRR